MKSLRLFMIVMAMAGLARAEEKAGFAEMRKTAESGEGRKKRP